MLFFNKKGVAIGTIVVLILSILAGVILIIGAVSWLTTSTTFIDRDTCRMSVALKAKSIIAGVEDFPWHVGLKCPTVIVDVSKSDEGLIKNLFSGSKNKKENRYGNFPTKSVKIDKKSDIERVIADEMYDTWYKFGAGKLNFFGKYSGERKCIISSILKFSSGVKEEFSEIENFETYLLEEKIPGKEIKYYDYFTQGEGILFSTEETGKIDIFTDKDLAIIYMLQQTGKGKDIVWYIIGGTVVGVGTVVTATIAGAPLGLPLVGIGLGIAGGTTLFGATGEASYKAVMLPIPYDTLPEECDELI